MSATGHTVSVALPRSPGRESRLTRGVWAANRWLILRRIVQVAVLLAFLAGPWFGLWIVKGNLTSSLTLGVLPLTDPLFALQSLAAGHLPYRDALIGAGLLAGFYLLVGGRVFCGWVCPMNAVTDGASALRRMLGLKGLRAAPDPRTRYLLAAGLLVASFAAGAVVWEAVNPVSALHRGLFFGMGAGWMLVAAVFLYDLVVAPRGWCGHLCPMGATYALLGRFALWRVSAHRRDACDNCMDCYAVCPEPQVIRPALKGSGSPVILASACTTCGRCADVCAKEVFRHTTRWNRRLTS